MHGREHVEKLVDGKAVVQVVEKRLGRDSCPPEDESAAHEFGIGMNGTVIECQHKRSVSLLGRAVNDSLGCATRSVPLPKAALFDLSQCGPLRAEPCPHHGKRRRCGPCRCLA